jgi:hypothetical protein
MGRLSAVSKSLKTVCPLVREDNAQARLSTTSADGRSIIVRIAEPGEAVGLAAALLGKAYELTAQTLAVMT